MHDEDAKSEADAEPKAEPADAVAKSEADAEPKAEPADAGETEAKSEADAERKADAAEAEANADAETDADAADADTKSTAEPAGADAEPKADAKPKADAAGAAAKADSQPAAAGRIGASVRAPWVVRIGLLVAGLALGGLAAWWFFVREAALEVPRDLLAAVPANVDVVARLDLGALRRSRHAADLFAETDRRSGTLARIRERCGFDPIEKVDELVVFATLDARGRTQDFAYVARGDLSRARSEACAEAVAGGEAGALRIERYKGRLVLASANGEGRIAMLDETHAVGGGKALVHGVIDVLTSGAPSLTGAAPLSAVIRRIGDGQDFAAALLLSPPAQRSLEGALPSALVSLAKARSIGVSAALRENRWRVGAVAQMSEAGHATTAIEALDGQLASLRRSPLIGLTVLGTVLGGVRLSAEGREAIGSAAASEDQIDEMVSLWRRFGRRRQGAPSALPPGLVPGLGDDARAPGIAPGDDARRAPPDDAPALPRDSASPRPGEAPGATDSARSRVHDRAQPAPATPGTADPGNP